LREAFSLVMAGAVKMLKFHIQAENKPAEAKGSEPAVVIHAKVPPVNPAPVVAPAPTPAPAPRPPSRPEVIGLLRGLTTDPIAAPLLPMAAQVVLTALASPTTTVAQAIDRMLASFPVLQTHPSVVALMQLLPTHLPQIEALRQSINPATLAFASMMAPQLLQNPMIMQMLESGNVPDFLRSGDANPWGGNSSPWGQNPWGGASDNSQNNPWGGASDSKVPAEDMSEDDDDDEDDDGEEEPATSTPVDAHVGVSCDGCGAHPICGFRYKCSVCADYDLCATCEAKDVHQADHPLIKMRSPVGPSAPSEPARPAGVPASVMPTGYMPQNFMPTGFMPTGFMPDMQNIMQGGRRGGGKGGRGGRGGRLRPRAKLVKECNLLDGTEVSPSQTLVKTWQVQNIGALAWPTGTKLQYMRGNLPFESSFPVGTAEPGAILELSAAVRTPQISGRFRSVFRLVDATGKKFGPRLVCVVTVHAPALPVPSAPVQPATTISQQPDSKYATQLAVLKSMGYQDMQLNSYLLEIHNGNVEAVCNWILEQK